jgi:hypothetical protein
VQQSNDEQAHAPEDKARRTLWFRRSSGPLSSVGK